MLRPALRALLVLALASWPVLSSAELYRWVDDLGVTHFTTDRDTIPRSHRDEAVAIGELRSPSPATRAVAPPPEPGPTESAAPELVPVPAPDPAPAATPPLAMPAPVLSPAPDSRPGPQPTPEPDTTPAPSAAAKPIAARVTAPPEAEPAISAPTVFPGPAPEPAIAGDDPRASEVAELEAQIASDREKLRQMISTKRWDSAELASDPEIREIAERLPRLQAQLAALQAEPAP